MELRAWVCAREQISQVIASSDISSAYVPMKYAEDIPSDMTDRVILLPPEYLADCEKDTVKKLLKLRERGFGRALAHTAGHIELLLKCGYTVCGGNRLNCTNSETIKFFADCGLSDIIVSPELTAARINRLEKPIPAGIIAYGHLPLMLCRRCPINDGKPCGKENCGKSITDRRGDKLRVICSENTVEILNHDVLMLNGKLDSFNVSFAVLRFTDESDTGSIIRSYAGNIPSDTEGITRGLYFRGVL